MSINTFFYWTIKYIFLMRGLCYIKKKKMAFNPKRLGIFGHHKIVESK